MYKFLVFLVVFVVAATLAADDGKYKPGAYGGDDGQYRLGVQENFFPRYAGYKGFIPYYGYNHYNDYNSRFYPYYRGLNYKNYYDRFAPESSNVFPFRSAVNTYSKPVPVPVEVFSPYKSLTPEGTSRILRQDTELSQDGYHYNYETENNIVAEEKGSLGPNNEGTKASGFFEYVGPDNIKYRVDYTADENGFRPVGDHLPTQPKV